MARILVVEDSVDLARALRTNLELEGHEVGVALDGERGLALVRSSRPDLIVLDLMLPKMDGYLLLRAVRGEGLHMPVLILTARSDEAEKVRGFRWGADDYVTKPFSLIELLARVEALLRRSRQVDERGRRRTTSAFRFGTHRGASVEASRDATGGAGAAPSQGVRFAHGARAPRRLRRTARGARCARCGGTSPRW